MLEHLKTALHKLWESSRYTIPVNQGQLVQARLTDGAFTLRDTQAKSPSASSSLESGSRVGVVSPGELGDLVATKQDEIPSASGISTKVQTSKESPDPGEVDKPREDRSGVIEAKKNIGVARRERRAKGGEDRYRVGRDADSRKVPERSRDPAKRGAGNGGRSNSPSDPKSRPERGEAIVQGTASGPVETPVNPNTDGRRQDEGSVGTHVLARRPQSARQKLDGEDPDEGNPKSSGGASSSVKRAGGAGGRRVASGGAACAPLAYDMKSILSGCRRTSRLKRKRDARNASAHSFSTKLSGCGATNQDSKAAARAFSRVLDKVCGVSVSFATGVKSKKSYYRTEREISNAGLTGATFCSASIPAECISRSVGLAAYLAGALSLLPRAMPGFICLSRCSPLSPIFFVLTCPPSPISKFDYFVTMATEALHPDARGRPIQPRIHDLSFGLGSLHLGPARLRRKVQLRSASRNHHHPPAASCTVSPCTASRWSALDWPPVVSIPSTLEHVFRAIRCRMVVVRMARLLPGVERFSSSTILQHMTKWTCMSCWSAAGEGCNVSNPQSQA